MDTTALALTAAGTALSAGGGYLAGRLHAAILLHRQTPTGRHARPEPARTWLPAWSRRTTRRRPSPHPRTANPQE